MSHSSSPPTDFFLFSSALMCIIDAQGIIIQLNPAWEKKFNIVCADIKQSSYLAWVHPDDKTNSHEKLVQLVSKKSSVTFSNRWRDCSGHYHWLNWDISVVVGKEEKAFGDEELVLYAVATDISAQKNTEKILRDTEERFELAIQGSNLGLWDWNLETNEIYLSPRWKNMLGYQDDEIANHLDEWCRFVHPDDFMQMWATIEAYLDKRTPYYESAYRVCHKDKTYRWVVARAAALWDANDQAHRMVGTYVDITERKRIEQALEENEALLSAFFEVTKIGLCVTDEQGQIVRVNSTYCELYGYSSKELIGQPFTLILAPEDHEWVTRLHQALLDGDPTVETEGEWHIQDKFGNNQDVSFTMGLLTQHNGQRFRVTAITDISKRKRLELERNRLFNLSLDMQSIIGFDGSIQEINAAWEHTLGWSKLELLEKSILDWVHPDDNQDSTIAIQQLIKGKAVFRFENRFLCKDGTYKWLSWNIHPLIDQRTMYAVTRDITQHKRDEEEIRRQQAFIRLVVDSVPNLIFIKDYLGRFIFVNQSVANLLGCNTNSLVYQKNTKSHYPSELLDTLYSKIEGEVIEYLHEIAVEETYCNAQGEPRCFHIVKKPFMQSDDDVLVLSVGTDITERKQYEFDLKRSEARYRAIVEDQTDLLCRYSPEGKLTFVNLAYNRFFGKHQKDLVFLDPHFFKEKLAYLTPKHPFIKTEHCITMPDNTNHWQQWINRAMFDEQGQVIEYQGVGRDITERKLAEDALRQSEERLRIVTSAAPVILFAIDNKGRFTFIRGKALSMFDLTDDDLVGQSIFDTFAPLPKQIKDIRCALAGKKVTSIANLRNVVFETKFTPLFDKEQQVSGVIGVSIDITKRHTLELQLKEAIAELETILDNSVIGIAYVKNGVFIRVNRKLESLLGYAKNELGNLPFRRLYPSPQRYQEMERQAYPLLSRGQEYDDQHLICTKTGNDFWSRIVGKAVNPNALDKGTIWMIEDITKQKETEQKLRLADTVFETSANGIIVTDLNTIIRRVNNAFTKITGYSFKDVDGKPTKFLSSGQHNKQFYQTMWNSIKNTGHWQGEIWNRKKNGEIYVAWLSISAITNEDEEPMQYMAVLTDISSLQADIEKVRYLANYDSLTCLPNRLLFHDNLLQIQKGATRYQKQFALLFIDLDGFKPINDNLGHAIGDQLLQGVAKRLQNCVREIDTVARLGGDEFTIILSYIKKAQEAANVATDIVKTLQQPFQISGHHVVISASIGISMYPYDSQEIDTLIRCADHAMYKAKHAGKGRYCFYKKSTI